MGPRLISRFPADLEAYSWNPLDADHLARLFARKYVSMSLERQLRLPPRNLTPADDLGLDDEELTQLRRYLQSGETVGAFGSLMPGLMTLDEVQNEVNLNGWKVKLSDSITVRLDVSEGLFLYDSPCMLTLFHRNYVNGTRGISWIHPHLRGSLRS